MQHHNNIGGIDGDGSGGAVGALSSAVGGIGKLGPFKPLALPTAPIIQPLRREGNNMQQPGADTHGGVSKVDQASKGLRSHAAPQGGIAAAQHQQQQQAEPGACSNAVKQSVLVRDVLRAVQGLKGTYMTYNSHQQQQHQQQGGSHAAAAVPSPADCSAGLRVASQAQVEMPEGQRTLIHELGELGLLFMRVRAAIAEGQQPGSGSVRQALCGALYEEVTDFYRLIAVLEGQLNVPTPLPGDAAAADHPGTYLTLRRLQLWLAEPLRRMRLLAALADASDGCIGGDLAGRVWAASKVGDPVARAYATRILQQVCVPLFDMIRHWVFDGQLQDPACEFFIVPNNNSSSSSGGSQPGQVSGGSRGEGGCGGCDLWRDAYRLEPAKLPPFITQDLAKTIERAGKSINFLRDACGDTQWVLNWAPAAAGAAAALGYGQLPVLERVVVSAGRSVDARLMAVLRDSGEWDRHCSAVRRYLLLGQGDFVVAFMDILGKELSKTAHSNDGAPTALRQQLRQALQSCASAGASAGAGCSGRALGGGSVEEEAGGGGVASALRIDVANAGKGSAETYWDLFSLRYKLGPPLNSVFTPGAQAQYARIAKLLWRLRRAERSLNDAWRQLKVEIERCLPSFKGDRCADPLRSLLRTCLHLHAHMAHVTTHLQYYINLEVVECAWSEFMSSAAAAPDLDTLIAAHESFLTTTLQRSLLGGGKAEGLRTTLTALLANCMGLAGHVNRFKTEVSTGKCVLDSRARQTAANTKAGGWGREETQDVEPAIGLDKLALLRDAVRSTEARHSQLLAAFIKGLPEAANEVNAEVRFLLARLDFTDDYNNSAK